MAWHAAGLQRTVYTKLRVDIALLAVLGKAEVSFLCYIELQKVINASLHGRQRPGLSYFH